MVEIEHTAKVAVNIRPSTLLKFRQCLVHRKYRVLFSPKKSTKPGPEGPSELLIFAIVELKLRREFLDQTLFWNLIITKTQLRRRYVVSGPGLQETP